MSGMLTMNKSNHWMPAVIILPNMPGEPSPLWKKYQKAAKGKIELMIELKATGREQSLVEDTLALIGKYDMENQCNIASLDIHLLKQAKALNQILMQII